MIYELCTYALYLDLDCKIWPEVVYFIQKFSSKTTSITAKIWATNPLGLYQEADKWGYSMAV